jgi:hypothetical protein
VFIIKKNKEERKLFFHAFLFKSNFLFEITLNNKKKSFEKSMAFFTFFRGVFFLFAYRKARSQGLNTVLLIIIYELVFKETPLLK